VLENALRHSDATPVDLEVAVDAGFLLFRVLDRGPGVHGSERERIFEPFVQGNGARTANRGGTGLGLAIARSVVEAQGGSVTYAPRAGGGSIFELRLPDGDLRDVS